MADFMHTEAYAIQVIKDLVTKPLHAEITRLEAQWRAATIANKQFENGAIAAEIDGLRHRTAIDEVNLANLRAEITRLQSELGAARALEKLNFAMCNEAQNERDKYRKQFKEMRKRVVAVRWKPATQKVDQKPERIQRAYIGSVYFGAVREFGDKWLAFDAKSERLLPDAVLLELARSAVESAALSAICGEK